MYLTELIMDLDERANPYDLHRKLWQLYDLAAGSKRPFQFRVEQVKSHTAKVLMQSAIRPLQDVQGIRILRSKTFSPAFQTGQRLHFRLTANPVKTIKDEKGRKNTHGDTKTCRVPLIDEAQQVEWLSRKLGGAARLGAAIVRDRQDIFFLKKGHTGKVVTVTFEGELLVDDQVAFTEMFTAGIGPAKSFGCGMLSLAPA
jgi:CRISPR system Cascade subunit CasE